MKSLFFAMSFLILTSIPSALQAPNNIIGLDLIDKILSTEKILSFVFLYFAVWAFPTKGWPWFTRMIESKQKMDYDYRMAKLAADEREEERQAAQIERFITSHSEIKEILGSLTEKINSIAERSS